MGLKQFKSVHLIGIGGAGLSGLAGWLKADGWTVTGCDSVGNDRITKLKSSGVKTDIGHHKNHVSNKNTWVIYSSAVTPGSPAWAELDFARKQGNRLSTYVEALGEISNKYNLIAVAGAHGKTTTTMMIGQIFEKLGLDVNYIVGEGIFRYGKANLFVIEACEYKRNFLNYTPNTLIVTNIALDHPDYYKDLDDVRSAFFSLIANIKSGGTLICHSDCYDRKELENIALENKIRVVLYDKTNIVESKPCGWGTKSIISLPGNYNPGNDVEPCKASMQALLKINIPGEHNVLNAIAAISATACHKIDPAEATKALDGFKGVIRRLERVGKYKEIPVISDWAHHPDQIEAVYDSLTKMYEKDQILVFYEPHQYERTWRLFDKFVAELARINRLFILPIYEAKGRESKQALLSVSAEKLVSKINSLRKTETLVKSLKKKEEIMSVLASEKDYGVLLFLSAGPLDDYIRSKFKKHKNKSQNG